MNILYISNDNSLYGANRSLLDMIEPITKKGHKAFVACWSHSALTDELEKRDIEYIVIPYKPSAFEENNMPDRYMEYKIFNYYLATRFSAFIKKNHIQIIHSNASNVDFGAILSKVNRVPHIWHIREALYDFYHLKYPEPDKEEVLMNKADKVIIISDFLKDIRKIDYPNTVTIYDGIETNNYLDHKQIFQDNVIKILLACSMMREKGVEDAVDAIRILVNEKGVKNIKLVIAGIYNGYVEYILEKIEQSALEEYITYVGNQSDLRKYRRWADISLTCSYGEAFGRVTVEGMLADILVIGADAGATSELIEHDKTGLLYQVRNAYSLAEDIIYAYEHKEKMRAVAHNGQKFAIENFANDSYAEKILKIYEEVM